MDDDSDGKETTSSKAVRDPSDGAYLGHYADPRGRVRDVCWLQNECEAVLSKPFHFYGSHMWVSQHDKLSLMQSELFTYFKGLVHQQESKVETSQSGQEFLVKEAQRTLDENLELKDKIVVLENECNRLGKKYREDLAYNTKLILDHAKERIRQAHHL